MIPRCGGAGRPNAVRRVGVGAVALLLLATVACAPESPTTTTVPEPLPQAPMLRLPAAVPAGSVTLVEHVEPSGDRAEYIIDDEGLRPFDIEDSADRLLFARALGWVSSTGVELRPLESGLARCTEFEGSDCEIVPGIDRAQTMGFSPDGTRFAVVDSQLGTPVLRMFDTSTLEQIVAADISEHSGFAPPVWSPDSEQLLLMVPLEGSDRAMAGSIATLEVRPGATPQVIALGDEESFAAAPAGWSDEGRLTYVWLHFSGPDDAEYTVRSRSLDGGDERVHGLTGQMSFPLPLADGSVIALPPPGEDGRDVVPHFFDIDGTESVPLALPTEEIVGGELRSSRTWVIGIVPAD